MDYSRFVAQSLLIFQSINGFVIFHSSLNLSNLLSWYQFCCVYCRWCVPFTHLELMYIPWWVMCLYETFRKSVLNPACTNLWKPVKINRIPSLQSLWHPDAPQWALPIVRPPAAGLPTSQPANGGHSGTGPASHYGMRQRPAGSLRQKQSQRIFHRRAEGRPNAETTKRANKYCVRCKGLFTNLALCLRTWSSKRLYEL